MHLSRLSVPPASGALRFCDFFETFLGSPQSDWIISKKLILEILNKI